MKNFFCIWCGQPTELLATCCSEACEDALAAYNAERNAEMATYDGPHVPMIDPKDSMPRNEMCEISCVSQVMTLRQYTDHCQKFGDYWDKRHA